MAIELPLPPIHKGLNARLYQSEDAPAVDFILNGNRDHDVRIDRDRIMVLGDLGKPVGLIAWRPGGIVHELYVGNGLGQRVRANLLVEAAIRDSLSRPFDLHEAIFVTDSDRMARYAIEIGAIEEVGLRVFTLDIRKAR
jgi:hypothetical protein